MSVTGDTAGRLHDRVVQQIGRSIVTGEVGPGAALVSERLAAELHVSRSVIREAFRVLEAKQLIVARPKVGTLVSSPTRWNYLDPQVISWRIGSERRDEQVGELYALRLAVEPVAARIAASIASIDEITGLTRAIDDMYDALDRRDLHSFTVADVSFHVSLLELSGNQMFGCLSGAVSMAVRARETLVFPLDRPMRESMRTGLDLHRQLVQEMMTERPTVEQTSRALIVHAKDEAERALGVWPHTVRPIEENEASA